jgi:hypothetical protein
VSTHSQLLQKSLKALQDPPGTLAESNQRIDLLERIDGTRRQTVGVLQEVTRMQHQVLEIIQGQLRATPRGTRRNLSVGQEPGAPGNKTMQPPDRRGPPSGYQSGLLGYQTMQPSYFPGPPSGYQTMQPPRSSFPTPGSQHHPNAMSLSAEFSQQKSDVRPPLFSLNL